MRASILAVGMVSALGQDWRTSCAAARCKISRAGVLEHYRVQVGDPWEVEFAIGHQADLVTKGFEGRGRIVRLLAAALKDLGKACIGVKDWPLIPMYLALPDPHRTLSNVELFLDEETGEEARARRAEVDTPKSDPAESIISHAMSLANWPSYDRVKATSNSGQTGMLDILEQSLADLAAGQSKYAMVGAVDSLLDDETLAWLNNTGRLKSPAVASGIIPGEAGVVFLLGCGKHSGSELGAIESLAFGIEERPFESGQAPLGKGISAVVLQIANETGWPSVEVPWVMSDHNGEQYRANDWGTALNRLTAANPAFSRTDTLFPAITFGDTGCAAPGLALAIALSAWQRKYSVSSRCCVVSCSDSNRRAGLLASASTSMDAP
jgi:3-oxoacyl-[acyl-carrier-protein] synthase I